MPIYQPEPVATWAFSWPGRAARVLSNVDPASQINLRGTCHMAILTSLTLPHNAGNRPHFGLPEQPLIEHIFKAVAPKDSPERHSTN